MELKTCSSPSADLVGGASSLRWFASEVTGARGDWSARIATLKARPAIGDETYWINDAVKSQPEGVREVCARRNVESVTKRAPRSVK